MQIRIRLWKILENLYLITHLKDIMCACLLMDKLDLENHILLLVIQVTWVSSLELVMKYFKESKQESQIQTIMSHMKLCYLWLKFIMREFKICWLLQTKDLKMDLGLGNIPRLVSTLKIWSRYQLVVMKKLKVKLNVELKIEQLEVQIWMQLHQELILSHSLVSDKFLKMQKAKKLTKKNRTLISLT